MKAKEIGNITVSVFKEFFDTNPVELTLRQVLVDLPKKFVKSITDLRAVEDVKWQKEQKKLFPMFTATAVCGVDPDTGKGSRRHEFAVKKNPILVIDIDKQDNPKLDMEQIKQEIIKVDSVYCVCKSIRGEGLFVVMVIEQADKLKEHFDAIYDDFLSVGIVVDDKCKDLTRARFISYDDTMLIKDDEEEIIPYSKLLEESIYIKEMEKRREENFRSNPVNKNRLTAILDLLFDECRYSGTGDYNEWISEGFRLYSMSYSLGYDYCLDKFITYSMNTPGFDTADKVSKKFKTFAGTAEKNPELNKLTGYYYIRLKRFLADKTEDKIKQKLAND